MKKGKLNLDQIKVESFVTEMNGDLKAGKPPVSETADGPTVFYYEGVCVYSCVVVEG
ncbi:MAG: pinensin family lanthipeptide [Cyclobacteriaceae bacterium]